MSCPEQWEEADELLRDWWRSPSVLRLEAAEMEYRNAVLSGQKSNERMKRVGAGRTEAPTFVLSVVVAIESLGQECMRAAAELRRRFE